MVLTTEIMAHTMRIGKMTSIPVHTGVLKELQARKTGGRTWDEFLLELLEEYDPPEWLEELERRRKKGAWLPAGELDRIHAELAKNRR